MTFDTNFAFAAGIFSIALLMTLKSWSSGLQKQT